MVFVVVVLRLALDISVPLLLQSFADLCCIHC